MRLMHQLMKGRRCFSIDNSFKGIFFLAAKREIILKVAVSSGFSIWAL